jgi:hypothetical protein
MKRLATSALLKPRAQAVLLLLASCSFQKFDYLEDGGGAGSGVGGKGAFAGSSNQQSGADGLGGGDHTEAGRPSGGSPGKGGKGNEPGGEAGAGEAGEPAAAGAGNTNNGGGVNGGTGGTGGTGGNSGTAGTGNTGATGELVNPSFESANTSGWTVTPADALSKRHAFVQIAQGGSSVPDGQYQFSTWHMTDVYTVQVFQVIKGLEDGSYSFKGYFSRGAQNFARIYARNCGGTVDPDPVDVPITSGVEWVPVTVAGIEVVGGSCEVGLELDSLQENWLNADLFTFEKDSE